MVWQPGALALEYTLFVYVYVCMYVYMYINPHGQDRRQVRRKRIQELWCAFLRENECIAYSYYTVTLPLLYPTRLQIMDLELESDILKQKVDVRSLYKCD